MFLRDCNRFVVIACLASVVVAETFHDLAQATLPSDAACLKTVHNQHYKHTHGPAGNRSQTVTLQISGRPSHQLVTAILKILVEEELGIKNVELVSGEDTLNTTSALNAVAGVDNTTRRVASATAPPSAMVSIELWMAPSFNIDDWDASHERSNEYNHNKVEYLGPLGPIGKFGWWVSNATVNEHIDSGLSLDFFRIYGDEQIARLFDLRVEKTSNVRGQPAATFSVLADANDKGACGSRNQLLSYAKNCVKGVYYSEACGGAQGRNDASRYPCAFMLASTVTPETLQLIRQIEAQKSRIAIMFLGDRLVKIVRERKTRELPTLFFDSEPSILTSDGHYRQVALQPCESSTSSSDTEECGFRTKQLSKVVWSRLREISPAMFKLVHRMNIEQNDYRMLLRQYSGDGYSYDSNNINKTEEDEKHARWVRHVACAWLNNNTARWQPWLTANEPEQLLLGGIFPLYSEIHTNADPCWGVSLERAARIAVHGVNQNGSLLHGHRLLMHSCNGACNADQSLYCYVNDQQEKELIGVVGPACSDAIEPILTFGKFARMLVVSYGAEASGLSDQDKYPYFYRTIPDNSQYGPVYANILREIGWGRVAAISEDGQKYPEYLAKFQLEFKKLKIEYSSFKIPRGATAPEQIADVIKQIKAADMRIIIGDFFENQAHAVLCAAYRNNMTAHDGYVWFLPNWFATNWYNTSRLENNGSMCTTDEMRETINYHFSLEYSYWEEQLDTLTVGGYTVREFRSRLDSAIAADPIVKRCPNPIKLHKYAGYAHDAVWAIALALDRLAKDFNGTIPIDQLRTPSVAAQYAKYLGELQFSGVSGHISFKGSNRVGDIIVRQRIFNPANVSEEPIEEIIGKSEQKRETIASKMPVQLTPPPSPSTLLPVASKVEQGSDGGSAAASTSSSTMTSSSGTAAASGYYATSSDTVMLSQNKIKWGTKDGRKPSDGGIGYCFLEPLRSALGMTCERVWVLSGLIGGAMAAVLIIAFVCIFVIRYSFGKKLAAEEDTRKRWQMRIGGDVLSLAEWEMPRNTIHLNRRLGHGAFGVVYGGEAVLLKKRPNAAAAGSDADGDRVSLISGGGGGGDTNKPVSVAVKTLAVKAPLSERLDFLAEAEIMKRLTHENIVKLYGVCTAGNGPFSIILEFMLNGDLKSFLLSRRDKSVNDPSDPMTIKDVGRDRLTLYALDVSSGVQYLHTERLVHRDLAARNCLVSADRRVKLSDFGLCRPVYDSGYYRFTRKAMMPVRWMAPESLEDGIFAPTSDVWGLGVVIYEIATLGGVPYPGKTNADVLELVKRGGRLSPPDGCTERLHLLLTSCWEFAPLKRPTAADICRELTDNDKMISPCVAAPAAFGNEAINLDGHANVNMALTGAAGGGGGNTTATSGGAFTSSKHHHGQKSLFSGHHHDTSHRQPNISSGGAETFHALKNRILSAAGAGGGGGGSRATGFTSQRSEPAAAKTSSLSKAHHRLPLFSTNDDVDTGYDEQTADEQQQQQQQHQQQLLRQSSSSARGGMVPVQSWASTSSAQQQPQEQQQQFVIRERRRRKTVPYDRSHVNEPLLSSGSGGGQQQQQNQRTIYIVNDNDDADYAEEYAGAEDTPQQQQQQPLMGYGARSSPQHSISTTPSPSSTIPKAFALNHQQQKQQQVIIPPVAQLPQSHSSQPYDVQNLPSSRNPLNVSAVEQQQTLQAGRTSPRGGGGLMSPAGSVGGLTSAHRRILEQMSRTNTIDDPHFNTNMPHSAAAYPLDSMRDDSAAAATAAATLTTNQVNFITALRTRENNIAAAAAAAALDTASNNPDRNITSLLSHEVGQQQQPSQITEQKPTTASSAFL